MHTERNGVHAFFIRDDVLDHLRYRGLATVLHPVSTRRKKAADEQGRRNLEVQKIDLSVKLPPLLGGPVEGVNVSLTAAARRRENPEGCA